MSLSQEQLQQRRAGIGSSDIGALVGLSPWASPIDVWLSKTGRADDLKSSVAMRIGDALEPLISELYAERTGARLGDPRQTFVHPTDSWRLATPDRVVYFGDTRKVLECKNDMYGHGEWGEEGTDEIPAQYLCQVQWQLDVLDLDAADVVALLGQKPAIYHVSRDEVLCASLREAAGTFWRDHVLADVQPPIDGSEGTKQYLARKHPMGNGLMVAADTKTDTIAEELAAIRGALDATEKRADQLANLLRERIGDNEGIEGADWRATWKRAKDTRKVDWQSVAKMLGASIELIERYTTMQPGSRRFLFKHKGE